MLKILIIDYREIMAEQVAAAFKNAKRRDVEVYRSRSQGDLIHLVWPKEQTKQNSPPSDFDLVLRHQADWKKVQSSGVYIVYSGGGLLEKRAGEFLLTEGVGPENVQKLFTYGRINTYLQFALGECERPEELLPPNYLEQVESKYRKSALPAVHGPHHFPYNQTLFIGNDLRVEEILKQLGASFQQETQKFVTKTTRVLNRKDWLEIKPEKFDCIFVAEECTWKSFRPFNGVDIVSELRIRGVRSPIIMLGFSEDTDHIKGAIKPEELRSSILMTPFIYRFLLDKGAFDDFSQEQWISAHKIGYRMVSPELLEDIQYYTLDWRGMFHETIHDLRYPYRSEEWESKSNTEQTSLVIGYLNEKIKPLLREGSETKDSFDAVCRKIEAELREATEQLNISLIRSIVRRHEKSLEALIKGEESEGQLPKPQAGWGVLIVDDQKEEREDIQITLEKHGLKVLAASSGIEAIEILEKDAKGELQMADGQRKPANFITVLIADWRMFEEGRMAWQLLQGYDLIRHISRNMSNKIAFHVLTAKTGGIMKQVQDRLGRQVGWFAKERVLGEGALDYHAFLEKVIASGNNIFKELVYRPEEAAKQWNRIAPAYQAYRSCPLDIREVIDTKIIDLVDVWINTIKDKCNKNEEDVYLNNLPELTNLGAKLNPKSNEYIKTTDFAVLINKMAARRIAMGLALYGMDSIRISKLLYDRHLIRSQRTFEPVHPGLKWNESESFQSRQFWQNLSANPDHIECFLLDIRELEENKRPAAYAKLGYYLVGQPASKIPEESKEEERKKNEEIFRKAWQGFKDEVRECIVRQESQETRLKIDATILEIKEKEVAKRNRQRFSDLLNTHLSLSREKILEPLSAENKRRFIDPGLLPIEEINWLEGHFTLSLGASDRELLKSIEDLELRRDLDEGKRLLDEARKMLKEDGNIEQSKVLKNWMDRIPRHEEQDLLHKLSELFNFIAEGDAQAELRKIGDELGSPDMSEARKNLDGFYENLGFFAEGIQNLSNESEKYRIALERNHFNLRQ